MKKTVLAIAMVLTFVSCTTGTKLLTSNAPADKSTYTILKEDKTVTFRNRIWILFIPITIGPKSEDKREARCLNRLLTQNNADGIITGKVVHRKFVIPLILVTYSFRNTIVSATPFRLNTDSLNKK